MRFDFHGQRFQNTTLLLAKLVEKIVDSRLVDMVVSKDVEGEGKEVCFAVEVAGYEEYGEAVVAEVLSTHLSSFPSVQSWSMAGTLMMQWPSQSWTGYAAEATAS